MVPVGEPDSPDGLGIEKNCAKIPSRLSFSSSTRRRSRPTGVAFRSFLAASAVPVAAIASKISTWSHSLLFVSCKRSVFSFSWLASLVTISWATIAAKHAQIAKMCRATMSGCGKAYWNETYLSGMESMSSKSCSRRRISSR